MSQNPAYSTVSDMEDDILAVGRWAGVLNHVGTATCQIDPAEVWVISNVLTEIGQRLQARWSEAFIQAGGRP